jgi:Na+-transporting methylmalonyl-CoA/oxaloacetate decarboxylase gamma subunit
MELGFGKALEYSALGIAIVFALIIVLMIVVKIMSAIITGATAVRNKAVADGTAAQDANGAVQTGAAAQGEKALAPGSAGDVKLYNVSDRDAAMIMAIVADKMQVPLNELRFLSIREVNEDEV